MFLPKVAIIKCVKFSSYKETPLRYYYCHERKGSVSSKMTWIMIGADLFAFGEITTTQITVTKNTWCSGSGVFFGVHSWSFF
jgi:hypothetical protein